jgi:hypothetical protein
MRTTNPSTTHDSAILIFLVNSGYKSVFTNSVQGEFQPKWDCYLYQLILEVISTVMYERLILAFLGAKEEKCSGALHGVVAEVLASSKGQRASLNPSFS